MRGLYPATTTYQRIALLHNALTVLWLGLPWAILGLAYLRLWPWAVACLLLDVAVALARTRTMRAANRCRPQPPGRQPSRR